MPVPIQDQVQSESLTQPLSFWARHAEQLYWHKKPSQTLKIGTKKLANGSTHKHWKWFPDGEISTSYNCIDRHVENGYGESTALIWDSPVVGAKEKYSYSDLLEEVETLAGVLRQEDVRRGDVVVVYMPMVPQAVFAILAISRLGAIHAVVFGGFAAAALAARIDASKPRVILTASCGIEGAKGPLAYKPFIEGALKAASHKPERIIIWQRPQLEWKPISHALGERDWKGLTRRAKREGLKANSVPVRSNDGLYVIYTSGTTGLPKGVLREAGGHAVGLNLSIRYLFGIHGPGDVMFCASDIGWVVGHSYIIYGPLLTGAATVIYEGKPVGTPDAGSFWRIIDEYHVNVLFTAPTALRAILRDDPDNSLFMERGARGAMKQLRALFLAGERSEPSIVKLYQELLSKCCAPDSQVLDNYWSSESGSPITSIALQASVGRGHKHESISQALKARPGSAGKPMPGFDVRVVDDGGNPVKQGIMGNIVLGMPLAPTGFTTLFNDDERFYNGYLKRFGGKWIDTGDAGMIDGDGYVHVMSRSDDIINVAAHRFSTGTIEQAIASHPSIAECCVVGIPDALKGHLPFAFVTLSTADHPSSAVPSDELLKQVQKSIREQIGAIAALGGMIQGKGIIPRTRSGKTLRRVLRELLENAVYGRFEGEVQVPATVEDAGAVTLARIKIKEYFTAKGGELHKATEGKAKI